MAVMGLDGDSIDPSFLWLSLLITVEVIVLILSAPLPASGNYSSRCFCSMRLLCGKSMWCGFELLATADALDESPGVRQRQLVAMRFAFSINIGDMACR